MARDIRLSTELGFNGSRLHQKVFEPQFLYLCDRAGYMVWGEFPSWGIDFSDNKRVGQFLSEWGEVLRRDFNHPSIVTWCPLNEVWGAWDNPDKRGDVRFAQSVYQYTKIYDTTRPCVDVSGGWHGDSTDLFDFHSYEEPDVLVRYFSALDEHDVLDVPLLYGRREGHTLSAGPARADQRSAADSPLTGRPKRTAYRVSIAAPCDR